MTAKSKPIPKSRRRFTPEFKAEAVRLVTDQGLSQANVGRDLGISPKVVSRWVREAKERSAPGALAAAERVELKRLRKQVRTLQMERDIPKKAAAFFAKESL